MSAQSWFKHAVLYQIDVGSFAAAPDSGGLKGIAEHLDYLRSLGVDAVLLTPLAPSVSKPAQGQTRTINPALGTLEDFDELSLEASRRSIRILLTLPDPDPAIARFWLTRGAAGFYIPEATQVDSATMQAIRKLLPTYVGQRVLITDSRPANPTARATNELFLDTALLALPSQAAPRDGGQIGSTSQLRIALEQSQATVRSALPVIATDALGVPRSLDRFPAPGHEMDMAKIVATVLMLNRSVALVYAGQELGVSSPAGVAAAMPWGKAAPPVDVVDKPAAPVPAIDPTKYGSFVPYTPDKYVPYDASKAGGSSENASAARTGTAPADLSTAAGQDASPESLLSFYRRLSQLHRGDPVIRDGEEVLLNHDDLNALIWVRKPLATSPQNPAVVIACNLSDKPLIVSLRPDMARLKLRGTYLRTMVRSDEKLGSMDLDHVTVPPFGVYVGDLRF